MPNDSFDCDKLSGMDARSIDLLGEEGFRRLRNAFVTVIGLGGVGSHAAAALARSGVGRLRLVDFDPVTPSSLNRNALATREDLGKPKVDVMAERLRRIRADLVVETDQAFFHEDTAERLLSGSPDMVVDAIDGFTPKVALLRLCVEGSLPVVSSMGASGRTDPSLLRTGDISETCVCPLARVVRRRLKKHGISTGIQTVYSIEPPGVALPPDEGDTFYRRGRERRRLPSLICMPGIFGYALASLVIGTLSESDDLSTSSSVSARDPAEIP